MGSWIMRRKRGAATVTRNLSTGRITTSTSVGNSRVRLTHSVIAGGKQRLITTERYGGLYKRTSRTIGASSKRSRSSGGDPAVTGYMIVFGLICVVLYYTWMYILIALGLVAAFYFLKAFMAK